jgi:putative oxidoreductase
MQICFAHIDDFIAPVQLLFCARSSRPIEEITMNPNQHGALITRVALGLVLAAHSAWLKAVVFTLPGTAEYFRSLGLPGFSAYAVFAIEILAGIALILGYRVRLAAAAVVPVLLGATWAHAANGWLFTNQGGGWEYPLLLAVLALAQVFLGAGSFALENLERRERPDRIAAAVS